MYTWTSDIIGEGADVNARNRFGQTFLIAAIVLGNIEIVELLIDSGADVNGVDSRFFKTALMHAVERNFCKAVELLINKGADVNFRRTRRCAKMLLEAGADVNVSTAKGESGLMFTAWHDDMKCAKLLLRAGAMVKTRDTCDHNAIERYTNERRYIYSPPGINLIRLLFAAGEKINEKTTSYEVPSPSPRRNLNTPPRLADMCRDRIRDHLMEVSDVNLFDRVTELGLPRALTNYLVYDEDVETGANE